MSERIKTTELLLGFGCKGFALLQPSDLHNFDKINSETQQVANLSHIYTILKRPRFSFVPNSVVYKDNFLSGNVSFKVKGVESIISFRLNLLLDVGRLVVSDYPHSYILLIDNSTNEILQWISIDYVLNLGVNHDRSVLDLQVVYVGMSYADGKSNAKDRLINHTTLQKILSEVMAKEPDMNILLGLLVFSDGEVLIKDCGQGDSLGTDDESDPFDDIEKLENKLSMNMKISLIEAALIRYFNPGYNVVYRESFPSRDLKILESLYELDINALCVELDLGFLNIRLGSVLRKPVIRHLACFDLHDLNARKSFFDFSRGVQEHTVSAKTFWS